MAAGSWYSTAGLGDANISVGVRALFAALHESSKNLEIAGHPVIESMLMEDLSMGALKGALGHSLSLAAIGQAKLASSVEGNEAAATNFSTSNVSTLTPARREFARVVSDFSRSLQGDLLRGEIAPSTEAMLVYEARRVWTNDLVDRLVALAASASNTIGTTGTALTWQKVRHGVIDMKDRGVVGERYLMLVDDKGAKDLSDDGLSLGGAAQMSAQMQQLMGEGASGSYIGTFFGNTDIHLCSELDTDSGDTLGLLMSAGGIHSKHERVPLPAEADLLADAGVFSVEALRQTGGQTRFQIVTYNSIGIREQGRIAAVRYKTT